MDRDDCLEEACQVAEKLLRDFPDDDPPPQSHLDWLQREIMKVLHAKCAMQRERDQNTLLRRERK